MYTDNVEAAYFTSRIERSTALAEAATGSCARLAHEAMVGLYEERLVGLKRPAVSAPAPELVATSQAGARS